MPTPRLRNKNMDLPRFDHGVSCLCWVYNEEELIEKFLFRIDALLSENVEDYEIVVVDDCSTDSTNRIIRRVQKSIPRISLYRNETNRNVGYSCRRAIQEARKEFLFWQTVDWSYDISNLREFLELLKTNDLVVGVRRASVGRRPGISKVTAAVWLLFGRHLTKRSDTIIKSIISICNYLLVRLLFRLPLSDYQNVVFYRTEQVQAIEIESESSFTAPELLLKFWWQGARLREVPISFIPRSEGQAKGTKFKAITKSLRDVFKFWVKWIVLGKRGSVTRGRIHRLGPEE